MKKILITGYGGFLGTHLINSLSSKYQIIGLSNKINTDSRLHHIKKDIIKINSNDLRNISCIIHLAAITDPQLCNDNPNKCVSTNVLGTQKILEVARKNNCKVIFASTSHVYGIPKDLPIKETFSTSPNSIYSGSKLAGEILCKSYSKQYNMDISIARIFSVYGLGSDTHYVLSNILSQLKNSNIVKLGNIQSKRDFVYISDVVKAFEIILNNTKGFNIYNIGTGKSYSIKEICSFIEKFTCQKITVKFNSKQKRKIDPKNIVCDYSKLKKLGWKPMISIYDGIKLLLN